MNLEIVEVDLCFVDIGIDEFLIYALFVGLGNDSNQEIKEDDDHENGL